MFRPIDSLLNKITMFNLVAYGLGLLALVSIVLGATQALAYQPVALVSSLAVLVAACYATNRLLGWAWRVPTNTESWIITALILFFILPPTAQPARLLMLAVAGIIAMTSKFLVAWRGRHIFNPAALAVAVLGLAGVLHATWWVGSSVLWPFTLVLGLLVVQKMHRFHLVLCFVLTALVVLGAFAVINRQSLLDTLQLAITSSPLIFLGTIMLTEPVTMPGRYWWERCVFGVWVGGLYAWHPAIGPLYVYPEVALLVGNVIAFALNPRYRLHLRLITIIQLSPRVYDFVFAPSRPLAFAPGQYMEFTLPGVATNTRGNRRLFTVASSPTEKELHVGIKTYQPSGAYKQKMLTMKPGDSMFAGQLSGSFTLPSKQSKKLAFIAGDVGITPFRSMLKYVIDTYQQRDIVVVYVVNDPSEIAYKDILSQATARGIVILPVVTGTGAGSWQGLRGPVNAEFLKAHVPEATERTFYVSGPLGMVQDTKKHLTHLGIARRRIITDYFPGY